jgi:Flp pilus assembly pilin Flp
MQEYSTEINKKGQTAVEYMLLLAAVVSILLVGFKSYFPTVQLTSNYYFNQIGIGILDKANPCGDGACAFAIEDCRKCPVDCGVC